MTDPKDDTSFAALFEESMRGGAKRKPVRTGESVEGTVVRVGRDGVYVELDGKRQGFFDAADLPQGEGAPVFEVGTIVKAKVVEVDAKSQMVRLGVAPPSATVGAVVGVTVERIEPFGVFVAIDKVPGRGGRGLIPNAELGVPRGADVRKLFPEGTKLNAKVLEAEPGRVKLSLRGAKDAAEQTEFEGYKKTKDKEKRESPRSLGTLGDLLKGHLGDKKR